MNVLRYINSKDIREHLRKIDYKFSALEAAWLIYQSRYTTLEERHQAWKQLIAEYPDCSIPKRLNTVPQDSLHHFLEEYMDMEKRMLKQFRDPTGAVFQLEYHYREPNVLPTNESRVFSYFDPEKMNNMLDKYDGLSHIRCNRLTIDSAVADALGAGFHVLLNPEMQIMQIVPEWPEDERDTELLLDVFQGFWFDFPTPFQKGDILWDSKKPAGFCGGPFVCRSINQHGIADEKQMEYMRENGDTSDMTAHGLFVSAQTGVYGEVMHNYMNCEYYRKELVGNQLLLKPFSAYEKGEADAELLVHACHYIMLELEKEYTGLEFYTAEALKKVGIG
ncbi:MAG: hypothetical protein IJL88_15545 [Clostridia bacterium]|nr:hypothetical protein [Clostridia bacterium]